MLSCGEEEKSHQSPRPRVLAPSSLRSLELSFKGGTFGDLMERFACSLWAHPELHGKGTWGGGSPGEAAVGSRQALFL